MRRRSAAIVGVALVVASCSSGGSKAASFADALCPAVMRWADDAVTTVNEFQEASPQLADPGARRAAYVAAFGRLDDVADALAGRLAALPYPSDHSAEIRGRLDTAVARVHGEYADDADQAKGLPDSAFAAISVNDGHLVGGNEKAKAIVFETVGEIWQDFHVVDENCGRHPPVTVDLDPG
jgi:hypothetical protein